MKQSVEKIMEAIWELDAKGSQNEYGDAIRSTVARLRVFMPAIRSRAIFPLSFASS
jgi:hypothetical protein